MNREFKNIETICSPSDIAAYLDGELDPVSELCLEEHLVECEDCFHALREQKMVLCALKAALDPMDQRQQIELPVNFARNVTVRAESNVNGLRKREERVMAFCLFAMLLTLVGILLAAGGDSRITEVLNQSALLATTIGSVVWAVLYNVGLGAVIIIRTLTRYLLSDSNVPVLGLLSLLILSLAVSSSFVLRFSRYKF